MIGKVQLTSVTYRQFCTRLRGLCEPFKPTDKELYREWNRCLEREGSLDYARHARTIINRRRRAANG